MRRRKGEEREGGEGRGGEERGEKEAVKERGDVCLVSCVGCCSESSRGLPKVVQLLFPPILSFLRKL